MFTEGQKVKVHLSLDSLEVYRLMGEMEPWFQDEKARVEEMVYEERDFDNSLTHRFYRVQFYNNSGSKTVLPERDLIRLEN